MNWPTIFAWAIGVPVAIHLTGWALYFLILWAKAEWYWEGPSTIVLVAALTFCWEDDLVEYLFPEPAASIRPDTGAREPEAGLVHRNFPVPTWVHQDVRGS